MLEKDLMAPEVVLPCDLPTWEAIQEYFMVLLHTENINTDDMVMAMLRIFDICNIAPDDFSCGEQLDESMFDDFRDHVENSFSFDERQWFMTRTFPCMVRYALSLGELRPKSNKKFVYSLNGCTPFQRAFDRRFVASLVANMFFSTIPRRPKSLEAVPDLVTDDISFISMFRRESKKHNNKLFRNILNYFEVLDREDACGHVMFSRHKANSSSASAFSLIKEKRDETLTSAFIMDAGDEIDPEDISLYVVRDLSTLNVACGGVDHPELLPILLFCERLDLDEFITVSNLLVLPSGSAKVAESGKTFSTIKVLDRSKTLQHKDLFKELTQLLSCLQDVKEQDEALEKSLMGQDSVTSSVSSKSSNLEWKMLISDGPPVMINEDWSKKDKVLSALMRGSSLTDDLYKRSEFKAAKCRFKTIGTEPHSKERLYILENICQKSRRRCLSLCSTFTVPDWDFNGEFLCVKTAPGRRYQSFESVSAKLVDFTETKPSVLGLGRKENVLFSEEKLLKCPTKKTLWIIRHQEDNLRFLVQWLSSSLSGIPLIIWKQQTDQCAEAAVAAICQEAEKDCWTNWDLLTIASQKCLNS